MLSEGYALFYPNNPLHWELIGAKGQSMPLIKPHVLVYRFSDIEKEVNRPAKYQILLAFLEDGFH